MKADVPRRIDALPTVVAFVDRALADSSLDAERRQAVHFVLEELWTNMIKYAPQGAPAIAVEIVCEEDVHVTLIDRDVDRFDPTRAPPIDVGTPLAERRPGGLGLPLIQRLVDAIEYRYAAERREGCTRFRIGPRTANETHAHD